MPTSLVILLHGLGADAELAKRGLAKARRRENWRPWRDDPPSRWRAGIRRGKSTRETEASMPTPDRIEKHVLLHAPLPRVWRALTDVREFGAWFGAALDGPFEAGTLARGRIEPTKVDPEIARLQAPHRGTPLELAVERLEPMRRFSFRWHPFAVDPGADFSSEPTTLVAFELEAGAEGTWLTISETGFDALPEARRVQAFAANDGGWTHQARLVARYLEEPRVGTPAP